MNFYEENVKLDGNRIYLRVINEKDKGDIFNIIHNDKDILKYYLSVYKEDINDFKYDEYLKYYKDNGLYNFAIILKDNDEVIGIIHQVSGMGKYVKTVELGYALKKKYWNKGYMSEALKLMMGLMFERGVHKISCGAIKENKASIEVMKKCGMLYEGTDIDDIYYHDQYWDTDYYYILEDMFHVEHIKEND